MITQGKVGSSLERKGAMRNKKKIVRFFLLFFFTIIVVICFGCNKPMTTESRKERMKELLKDKYGEEFEVRELYDTGTIESWCYPVNNPSIIFKADTDSDMKEIKSDFYLQNIVCRQVEDQLQMVFENVFGKSFVSAHISTSNTNNYINPRYSDITLKLLEDYYEKEGIGGRIAISVFVDKEELLINNENNEYDLIKENIWERVKDGEYPNTHFSIFVGDDKNLLNAKKILEEQNWDSRGNTEDIFDVLNNFTEIDFYFDNQGNGYIYTPEKNIMSPENYRKVREEFLANGYN